MTWGTVELEPEVTRWLEGLSDEAFGRAAFYVDLLEREGVHLDERYTRKLRGKLRELRFYLGREQMRVSYFFASGGRIIRLTVFRKTRQREAAETARAEAAMSRCVAEEHTAEEDP
jgi:hypothetical protein